jgi:Tol biopolymer transport system component
MKRLSMGVLVAGLSCLLVLASPAAGGGSSGSASGQIVFVTERLCGQTDCGGGITVVNSDGSGMRLLHRQRAATRVTEYSPKWSPDRREIAYVRPSRSRPGSAQVWLMAADGTHRRQLTHLPPTGSLQLFSGDGTAIDWSPNGRQLVFADGPSGNLYVANARTGAVSLLRRTPYYWVTEPVWSPDGRWIVFIETPRGGGTSQLIRLSTRTHRLRQLTHLPKNFGVTSNPSWSPDSRRIALHLGAGLHVINLDGSHLRSLRTERLYGIEPSWSPDGISIVFADGNNLAVMKANGFSRHLITHLPAGKWAAFEPDW